MDIKPLDLTVKELLERSFYKIPRFQRPYSWDRENVEDFWNDAILADDPDYFIGSFVLYRSKNDADLLFIVDGQQRLTTMTLLLAAARDSLDSLGYEPLASSLQKLIEREDINGDLRYVLGSETPYPYLQEQIQKYGDKSHPGALGKEQLALENAYAFLSEQIGKALESIDSDTTVAERAKVDAKRRKLQGIRDRVLRLHLISVELGNEDDAYLIFETLNTRGKDLTVSDLIKNYLTRLLKPSNVGVDTIKDRWNSILELFDKSESDLNINRFLHHSWLSRKPYTTEKKLYKEIKRSVVKNSADIFVDSLVSDAQLYRQTLEPDSCKWTKQERPLADSIRALNVFRVVQPVPMMLSLLRSYRAEEIALKQAKQVFKSMENFHAQFTAVTSQRTGGGTALMYASSARQIVDSRTVNARQKVIWEFVGKLRERVPSYEEFEAAFTAIRFTDDNTRQRSLVRYLLSRIDRHLRAGALPDYSLLTIEHLAPQRPSGSSDCSPEVVGMLGNLLLVTEELNGRMANKAFKDKVALLRKTNVPLDELLAEREKWDSDRVLVRTKALATLCHREIFKV